MEIEKWGIDRRNQNLIVYYRGWGASEPYALVQRAPINYGCYGDPKPDIVLRGKVNGERVLIKAWDKYRCYTKEAVPTADVADEPD